MYHYLNSRYLHCAHSVDEDGYESSEMLDIALANRVYDIGRFFSQLGIGDIFQRLAASGSTDFASSFAKSEKVANKMLEKLIRDFSAIE